MLGRAKGLSASAHLAGPPDSVKRKRGQLSQPVADQRQQPAGRVRVVLTQGALGPREPGRPGVRPEQSFHGLALTGHLILLRSQRRLAMGQPDLSGFVLPHQNAQRSDR